MNKFKHEVKASITSTKASTMNIKGNGKISGYKEPTFEFTLFEFETDWGKERLSLYYDEENGKDCLATDKWDFVIVLPDPEKTQVIDNGLIEAALNCWANCYGTYGSMRFNYDDIEDQINEVYNSIY